MLVLFCPVVLVELSFGSVSHTRHLLDAILRLSVCLLLIVGRGGVRFPGEVGVFVHPRQTVVFDRLVVMSGGHCTHPTGGPAIRLKHKKNAS